MSRVGFQHDETIPINILTGTSTRPPQHSPSVHRWVEPNRPMVTVEIVPVIQRRNAISGGEGLFRLLNMLQVYNSDPNDDGGLVRDNSIILDIEKRPYRNTDINITCNICQENFTDGEYITTLEKCEHTFHYSCIEEWGYHKQECPLCREPIPVLEE